MEISPRMKQIFQVLLKEKSAISVKALAEQVGVSKRTVQRELEYVNGCLKPYELKFMSKTGVGIWLEGSEEDYRRAIRAFVNENIDTRMFREAYEDLDSEEDRRELLKKSNVGQILNDDIMRRVTDCIMGLGDTRVMTLTENSYVGLVIHLSIAINRIVKEEVIEADERWKPGDENDEDYQLAKAIARELEEEFEIEIPEVEVSYICLHIKGAKHETVRWGEKTYLEMEGREMQRLLNEMLDAFDRERAYLLRQDDEFIQELLAHLQPTLIRLLHGMAIQNPILDDIRQNYGDIYARCEKVAQVLEASTGHRVPPEEIGFLTVHFGAALVRLEGRTEKIRKVHVGVVCSSGIGISRLMSSRLGKIFRDRMFITTYGKNDITPYIAGKMDFLISSIPLEPMEVPVIFVNPLLNEVDIEAIRNMLYRQERLPKKEKEADAFSIQLEEINKMADRINAVIKYMEFFKVDNRITFEELLIAVGERLSPYSDRREMIREDIMRRERIATQVFAEFGFALLHARTKGVIRPSFGVCMTKDLGAFGDPYFKGIKVVFIMLVPEDADVEINNEVMGSISSMLVEDSVFLDIVLGGQKEEIRSALSRHLKRFFNKYLSGLS